jgi:sec-independent protein translocase protein TatC
VWAFVAPGLYASEQRLVLPVLVSSTLLFYCGVAFAYFVVFPVIFGFFTSTAPTGVAVMTDINSYLDFILSMFVAFGVVFEIPVATVLLVRAGVIERAKLKEMRPYVILGCFVVGAFLTPPDVVSQSLLAVPMWLLYEAGVWVSGLLPRRAEDSDTPTIHPAG